MRRLVLRGSQGSATSRVPAPPFAGSRKGSRLPLVFVASALLAPSAASAQQAGCSGLACLFDHAKPPAASPPATPPAPVSQAATEPAVTDDAAPGVTSEKARKPRPARPVVTIAAPTAEVARVRSLAAALPRERIKVIPVTDGGERVAADFTVGEATGAAGTKGVAKLFTEQLHIVAGEKVHTVADLAGKVVAFAGSGAAGEGAARQAFSALNVAVKDTPLDVANALDGLSTGDLDAVVILAPQPVAPLEVVKAPGLHLVSWPEGGAVPDGTTLTSIEGARYPALARPGETIRMVGVDAVLTMSAKGAKDPAARAFLGSLTQNAAALSKRGFNLLKADNGKRGADRLASAERR